MNESRFKVGQRVSYTRHEVEGQNECDHCGSIVDTYEEVVSEHTVLICICDELRGDRVYYTYLLSDLGATVPQEDLKAVE